MLTKMISICKVSLIAVLAQIIRHGDSLSINPHRAGTRFTQRRTMAATSALQRQGIAERAHRPLLRLFSTDSFATRGVHLTGRRGSSSPREITFICSTSSGETKDNATASSAGGTRRKRVRRKIIEESEAEQSEASPSVDEQITTNDGGAMADEDDDFTDLNEEKDEQNTNVSPSFSAVREDDFVDIPVQNIQNLGRSVVNDPTDPSSRMLDFSTRTDDSYLSPGKEVDNNNLERLLDDAKRMRSTKDDVEKDDELGTIVSDKINSIISSVVTVDFFIVCGLLLWFVAGVFCSYVLKNDIVQIAFNGIFQPVVQPALGILMIGSAAGVCKKLDGSKHLILFFIFVGCRSSALLKKEREG